MPEVDAAPTAAPEPKPDDVNPPATAAEIYAAEKAKTEAAEAKEKKLNDMIAAEKAAAVAATKGDSDKGGDDDPNAPVQAGDHPAIAQLEGVAASVGHTIDVSNISLHKLPLRPIAVDRLGRIWAVNHAADASYLEYVGNVQK